MKSRREQVWVGAFVLIAVAVLVVVVLSVSGTFSKKGVPYRAYFKFASGLEPAAPVRYGGLLAGRIETLRVDPNDSTRIEIDFRVNPTIPVKTNSLAKITALGALGENYLEITTGTKDAPLAPAGSVITSKEMVALADLGDIIGGMAPSANEVLTTMNARLTELKVTIANANDLLGERNRNNISSGLDTLNSILAENRPKISKTLDNFQTASDKLPQTMANVKAASDQIAPMLEDFKKTIKVANDALAHVDAIVVENRPEIRATIADVRKTLTGANAMIDELRTVVSRNSDNLDETLLNLREGTANMAELTDTLKRHPSVLIRGEIGKDRQPGSTK
jgi:phospholipid/cholesterol/gamma-HCH transport system substrate-binding protein